ncbi:MAG: hypothetical protein ABJA67_07215 [Chthonomonadales bacterium]
MPEPPIERLTVDQTIATGGIMSKLMRAASADMKNLKNEFDIWMIGKNPRSLFNTANLMTEDPRDLRNPQTLEDWAAANKADNQAKSLGAVFKGVLGTLPFLGTKIVSGADSLSTLKNGDKQYENRVKQLINILDNETTKATGQPAKPGPPQCSTEDEAANSCSGDLQEAAIVAKSLRDKLLLSVLYGYNSAGLYHQAHEFYDLAQTRWGAVSDPAIRAEVSREIAFAHAQLQSTYIDQQGGDPSSKGSGSLLDIGRTSVINFKATKQPSPTIIPGVFINATPYDVNADQRTGFRLSLIPVDAGKMKVVLNNVHVPGTIQFNGDNFNSIKLQFLSPTDRVNLSADGDKVFSAGVKISINGQEIGIIDIPLPNQSRIVLPDGKWSPPPPASTRGFHVDTVIMGDAQYAIRLQFSDLPNSGR